MKSGMMKKLLRTVGLLAIILLGEGAMIPVKAEIGTIPSASVSNQNLSAPLLLSVTVGGEAWPTPSYDQQGNAITNGWFEVHNSQGDYNRGTKPTFAAARQEVIRYTGDPANFPTRFLKNPGISGGDSTDSGNAYYDIAPDENGQPLEYGLQKMKYQWQMNAETNLVITWAEIFHPGWDSSDEPDRSGTPVVKVLSWTNTTGATNSPPYTIDPSNYTNSDGSMQTNTGWYEVGELGNIVPDYNRDGMIDSSDYGKVNPNNPYHFWINDSNESGDIASGGNDIPASSFQGIVYQNNFKTTIQGREDIINYFPIYLDISKLVTLLPPGQYTYQLSQADSAVHLVYTTLAPAQVGGFLTNASVVSMYTNAAKIHVTARGVTLSNSWVNSIGDAKTAGGVLLIDGVAKTTNPLVLSVLKGSQTVASLQFPLGIDVIGNMYRTINLMNPNNPVNNTANPPNYPDSRCNNKMVVFVHGYNVNQSQSTAWFAEAFKRLYQSGANSMFTGVIWNGAVSQIGTVSPNYWVNVDNAFATAPILATTVNALPGSPTTMIAHSLGNMVVSSAINDYGLNIDNYFMLDAAIPMEAFDPSVFGNPNMANPAYNNVYNTNHWASYWYQLFPASDGRSKLTWQSRFSNSLANVVNYWSSGEDVLANGNGTFSPDIISGIFHGTIQNNTWTYQEMAKGTAWQATFSALSGIIDQGGWGINPYWGSIPTSAELNAPVSVQNSLFQTNTFFTPFSNSGLTGPSGSSVANNPAVKNQTLAEAIPALSYAVGRNPFKASVIPNNYDMTTQMEDGWPAERTRNPRFLSNWLHGDAKDVAYPFTHPLWQSIVTQGSLDKNQ